MPSLEYFVVAESMSVDQQTNQVSVFNILEEVRTSNLPVVLPQVVCVCTLNLGANDMGMEHHAVLRVRTPRGEPREFAARFKASHRRQRVFTRLLGLPLETIGELVFEISVGGLHLATHTVFVELATPQGSSQSSRPVAIGQA